MQEASYIVRPMQDADIPQVSEIDREVFPGEWLFRSFTSLKQELRNSLARHIVVCTRKEIVPIPHRQNMTKLSWFKRFFNYTSIPKEAKYSEYIVGFAGFWLMLKEAHITAIGVRNDYRQLGIGERLLISIIDLATQLNANMVTLEVRASNESAQSLYRKYGFQVVGRRLRYYSDNGEDAVIMDTDTITSASFQASFQQLKEAHEQRYSRVFTEVF